MSLTATTRSVVSATVSLRVPRGEAGDLESGVATVLGKVDGVDEATVGHVSDVRPTWTDIRVEADVELVMATGVDSDVGGRGGVDDRVGDGGHRDGDLGDLETQLEDGFGVIEAVVERVEPSR